MTGFIAYLTVVFSGLVEKGRENYLVLALLGAVLVFGFAIFPDFTRESVAEFMNSAIAGSA